MKRIKIYTNDGDEEITIKDNGPAIIEISNGQKSTRYQIQGTKIKKVMGKKHRDAVDMTIQSHQNTRKTLKQ